MLFFFFLKISSNFNLPFYLGFLRNIQFPHSYAFDPIQFLHLLPEIEIEIEILPFQAKQGRDRFSNLETPYCIFPVGKKRRKV